MNRSLSDNLQSYNFPPGYAAGLAGWKKQIFAQNAKYGKKCGLTMQQCKPNKHVFVHQPLIRFQCSRQTHSSHAHIWCETFPHYKLLRVRKLVVYYKTLAYDY